MKTGNNSLLLSAALVMLVWVGLPIPAFAGTTPIVYHSPNDDGQRPPFTPLMTPGPNVVLHLYMDEAGGTAIASPSGPCASGVGEERCGWDVAIEAYGGVGLVGFLETGDVVAGLQTSPLSRLRTNGGQVISGELGPVKLGDLEVVMAAEGGVYLKEGRVVAADQQPVDLPQTDLLIVVPEPDWDVSLAAGCALLLGIAGAARRRSESTADL